MESNEPLYPREDEHDAANKPVCEEIAKVADLIAKGEPVTKVRAALGAAHAVLQRNRLKISQFHTEAHLESLQQLIAIGALRSQTQEGL